MSYIFNSTKRNRKPNSWFRNHHKIRIQESGIWGIKRGPNRYWKDMRLRSLRSQSDQMWRCSRESFLCWLCRSKTMSCCLRLVLAQCEGCLQKLTAAPGIRSKKKAHQSSTYKERCYSSQQASLLREAWHWVSSPLHTPKTLATVSVVFVTQWEKTKLSVLHEQTLLSSLLLPLQIFYVKQTFQTLQYVFHRIYIIYKIYMYKI